MGWTSAKLQAASFFSLFVEREGKNKNRARKAFRAAIRALAFFLVHARRAIKKRPAARCLAQIKEI